MSAEMTVAEQVAKMIEIRNAKAKSVAFKVADNGNQSAELVPYRANVEGVYYDNLKRKWMLGIDPAGNIVPVMLSTARDPMNHSTAYEASGTKGREAKGWMWLERVPYGCPPEKWESERVRIIEERRAAHKAKATPAAPTELEKLAAVVVNEIRPAAQAAAQPRARKVHSQDD